MKLEKGYIYIVTNPMMTGYIKIGYAKDINERLKTFNTGSIKDYEPYAAYEVYSYQVDKQIHGIIELLNPRLRVPNKEFFRMEPEEAYELLQRIAKITSTEDRLYKYINGKPQREIAEQIEMNEIETIKEDSKTEIELIKRRTQFRFSIINLKPGDILQSTIDPNCYASILDDNYIIFENKKTSLSAACSEIYFRVHPNCSRGSTFQGPSYWAYNGKTLEKIRMEIENNG